MFRATKNETIPTGCVFCSFSVKFPSPSLMFGIFQGAAVMLIVVGEEVAVA